ncbi:MAG TPA: hypothetical protein PK867_18785, partial [Pirellulales bacterium]|nr:hypothetical protein [Pirellulales bacterium]
MKTETVQIIDCGRGPQLSTTRITVLDVFYYLHRGYDFAAIHRIMPTLTRAEYDVVEEYVSEHYQELVGADRRAEEFIQEGIAAQKTKGVLPDIDPAMPQEQRLARLKTKLHPPPGTCRLMNLPACLPVVLIATLLTVAARGDDVPPAAPPACAFAVDNYFVEEVWTKVGAQKCLNCHKAGGDAEDSRFVLRDPQRVTGNERRAVLEHNRDAFTRMAQLTEGGTSRLLVKMTGGLDHGGQVVLPADTSGYRILADFVSRGTRPADGSAADARDSKAPPFFQGITTLDDRRHLRRASLSLVGRLPASAELETIQQQGLPALPGLLNKMFEEEAFYERLREGFNDIFLTIGITGNPDQVVLAYEHFTNTRQWYAKHDLSHIQDEVERRKAGYKLADDYRHALLAEPMQLVDYIVRHDRPFTEIVTADYILVSPFSARGYGIYDEIKDRFQDPDNPHEFIPVKLKALVG